MTLLWEIHYSEYSIGSLNHCVIGLMNLIAEDQ